MSNWKDKEIKIIQITPFGNNYRLMGLGDDGLAYEWNYAEGAWKKYWNEEDKPS